MCIAEIVLKKRNMFFPACYPLLRSWTAELHSPHTVNFIIVVMIVSLAACNFNSFELTMC